MKHADYDKIDAVRSTNLIKIADCPASYFIQNEETQSLSFGRATHTYILQKPLFTEEYAVMMEVDGRTKEGKAYKEEFSKQVGDREIITIDDADTIACMAESVRNHPTASEWLSGDWQNQSEIPALWNDEETGIKCKTLADWIDPKEQRIINLKTTHKGGANERSAFNSMVKYGYHISAAMQLEGFRCIGRTFTEYAFIVVEKEPPYRVECFTLDSTRIEAGYAEYKRLLRVLSHCQIRLNCLIDECGMTENEARKKAFPAYTNAGAQVLI